MSGASIARRRFKLKRLDGDWCVVDIYDSCVNPGHIDVCVIGRFCNRQTACLFLKAYRVHTAKYWDNFIRNGGLKAIRQSNRYYNFGCARGT